MGVVLQFDMQRKIRQATVHFQVNHTSHKVVLAQHTINTGRFKVANKATENALLPYAAKTLQIINLAINTVTTLILQVKICT